MRKSYVFSSVLLFIISVFLTLQMPQIVDAAQTVHLKLQIMGNEIEGESTISSMERFGTIEIQTFSNKMSNRGGKKSYGAITFVKRIDKTTPLLYRAMDTGDKVDLAEFHFFRPAAGSSGAEEMFLTIRAEGGNIASISNVSNTAMISGPQAPPMMETVTLKYDTLRITYEIGGAEYYIKQPWLTEPIRR